MKWLALFAQFSVIVLLLNVGQYLLDVPVAMNFTDGILHFFGLLSIMISASVGGAVYRSILNSRGKG